MSDFLTPLTRAGRRLRCRFGMHHFGQRLLRVVYHERYNAAFPGVPNDPLRAERILAFLASEGLIVPRDIHTARPISLAALERVHTGEYLDRAHEIPVLTSILGSEVGADQVDRVLALQRLQTGGSEFTVRLALKHGLAVNLGGGFHHALRDEGGGFCVFNDIAVAVNEARRRGLRGPVLVVDLDLHDGNGTREIFADDPEVHTFSIHAADWEPTEILPSCAASTSVALGSAVDGAAYLAAVREHLPPLVRELRPKLVIYLAGQDPSRHDQMGDWRVDDDALLERDLLVARLAGQVERGGRRTPLAILLAGGYGPEAWRVVARFLSAIALHGRAIEPPSTEEMTLKRYRHLARLLDSSELSGSESSGRDDPLFSFSEDDLFLPGWGAQRETRFLGFYTRHGIELVLERSGLLDRVRDLGYEHPELDLRLGDPGGDTLRIFADASRRAVLAEVQVRRDRRRMPGFELLWVEWLLLQNPRAEFSPHRPALPGQNHPGLGMMRDIAALLTLTCDRLHLDGLIFVPSAYHIAAQASGYLYFAETTARDRFEALQEAFRGLSLGRATRALAAGRVRDAETGEVVRWEPAPMLVPVSEALRLHVEEIAHTTSEVPRPRYCLDSRDDFSRGRPA